MNVEGEPTTCNITAGMRETLIEISAAGTLAATIQVLREACEMLDHGIEREVIAEKLQGLIFRAQAALRTP